MRLEEVAIAGKTGTAQVVGQSERGLKFLIGAQTQEDGSYSLRNVPVGARTVRATRIGFSPQEREVTVVAGGPERTEGLDRGYYVRPTVLAGVTPGSTVEQEEVFALFNTLGTPNNEAINPAPT